MPIYAYKCGSCGYAKDVLQKIADALLTDCPECGKPTFSKQLTAAGFQLKGSGWYATDFKGGAGSPAAPAAEAGAAAPAADSGGASTDSASSSPAASTASAAPAATAATAVTAVTAASGGCATGCACH